MKEKSIKSIDNEGNVDFGFFAYLDDDSIKDYAREDIEFLRKLKSVKSFKITSNQSINNRTPSAMQLYIDTLKELGLDIGKRDSEFGYKMPLPEKYDVSRNLIIFRRR